MGTIQEELLKAGLISKERAKKLKEDERAKKFPPKKLPPKAAAPANKPRPQMSQPPLKPVAKPKLAPPPAKPVEKIHEHHLRTLCEACGKTSPDVEYYQHHNRSMDKFWLCIPCADDHNIPDATRQTNQSLQAQKRMFIRRYGATKVFKPGAQA